MFEKKPDKLNLPAQSKAYRLSGKNTYELIKMQNGSPLFVRSNSKKSAYIFASSLTENFGNFTSNALFSSILLRIAESSQRRYPISLTIGSEVKFPIFSVPQIEEPLKIKSATKGDEKFDFIPQIEITNDLTEISINKSSINSDLKSGSMKYSKVKLLDSWR